MSGYTRELQIGSILAYDGARCTVIEMIGDELVVKDSSHQIRRLRIVDLLSDADWLQMSSNSAVRPTPSALRWADSSVEQREVAEERAAHIRELESGYRSGHSGSASVDEPRHEYIPSRSMSARRAAKARELGKSARTVQRWQQRYADGGVIALLDYRTIGWEPMLGGIDLRWVETARRVLAEELNSSKATIKATLAKIEARVHLEYSNDSVRIPPRTTAYRAIQELTRGQGTFTSSTKARRSIANRPSAPYGRLVATRPGEYVLLDTTPLNVFGIVPITGSWMRAELTVAMDLYDRSILGLKLSPVSTKSIDVAGVLMEVLHPYRCPPDWGDRATWPFHGIPTNILVDGEALRMTRFKRPGILPDTVVVDHGKPFMSAHVRSVCQRLGISIQPAHVYTPTDKAQVERFFRTIDDLLQELPGYKGKDVASRGLAPENDAVYTLPQLEQIIREWIATVYHLRPHAGLIDPQLPGIKMSPAERYAQGIAIAGRMRVPVNAEIMLELLPIVTRSIHHYGVEVGKLRYTGEIVAKYHDRSRSNATGKRKWQFSVNPDDLSRIYFNDPEDGSWHTLHWEHAGRLSGPFSEDALDYAKQLALNPDRYERVEDALSALLERWGAGRASAPAERRISARLAAQFAEDPTGPDQPNALHTLRTLNSADVNLRDELGLDPPRIGESTNALPGDDDVDDELDVDNVLELMDDL